MELLTSWKPGRGGGGEKRRLGRGGGRQLRQKSWELCCLGNMKGVMNINLEYMKDEQYH